MGFESTSRNGLKQKPAVWFPAVRTNTGTDVFTERLVKGLRSHGIRAEISWLPRHAEYAPWTVSKPVPPKWATLCHVNSWLHPRFIPRGLPVVATLHHAIHDPALRSYKGLFRSAYHDRWIAVNERRVLQRANSVVAVSEYAAALARRKLCEIQIQVIHNGINTSLFRPAEGRSAARRAFRLLYVGSWKKLKGIDLLAPIMRELGPDFELLYTGGHNASNEHLGMPKNMHDIRRLDGEAAVVAAMQKSDALLLPSRSEGFGLVVAEAMACGLPVIATRIPVLEELIRDGATGFLCEQDDICAFVSSIRKCARDRAVLVEMASQARRVAQEMFSEEVMFGKYIRLYEVHL